jgi:hypothetical protein
MIPAGKFGNASMAAENERQKPFRLMPADDSSEKLTSPHHDRR